MQSQTRNPEKYLGPSSLILSSINGSKRARAPGVGSNNITGMLSRIHKTLRLASHNQRDPLVVDMFTKLIS